MSNPAEPAQGARTANRMALLAIGAVALLVFVAVVVASYRRSPDIGGVLSGLFTGLFAGLMVAGLGLWAIVWLASPKRAAAVPDPSEGDELERLLAPTLTELERTRAESVRTVNARIAVRLPIGIAAGVGAWTLTQFGGDPGGLFDLLLFGTFGAMVGWFWAAHALSEQYRRLYKECVLPQLAAQFGALGYRRAVMPDLGLLCRQRIFRDFDRIVAEDEIFGQYRGLALNIVELLLTSGSGKQKRTEFDGLLTQVALPRNLTGTTAVIADNGTLGNLRDRFETEGRQRVRIEDPRFEALYEVYGTDQIGARALLTPAFIERFLALGERPGFLRPLALAQGNRLSIALPTYTRDLFEPPSYRDPAGSRDALLRLYDDIAAVLRAADAVIDLDQSTRAAVTRSDGGDR